MSIILALFNAIAALPAIANSLEKGLSFLIQELQAAKNRKLAADLNAAAEKAQKEKDTAALDAAFNPSKK